MKQEGGAAAAAAFLDADILGEHYRNRVMGFVIGQLLMVTDSIFQPRVKKLKSVGGGYNA